MKYQIELPQRPFSVKNISQMVNATQIPLKYTVGFNSDVSLLIIFFIQRFLYHQFYSQHTLYPHPKLNLPGSRNLKTIMLATTRYSIETGENPWNRSIFTDGKITENYFVHL